MTEYLLPTTWRREDLESADTHGPIHNCAPKNVIFSIPPSERCESPSFFLVIHGVLPRIFSPNALIYPRNLLVVYSASTRFCCWRGPDRVWVWCGLRRLFGRPRPQPRRGSTDSSKQQVEQALLLLFVNKFIGGNGLRQKIHVRAGKLQGR